LFIPVHVGRYIYIYITESLLLISCSVFTDAVEDYLERSTSTLTPFKRKKLVTPDEESWNDELVPDLGRESVPVLDDSDENDAESIDVKSGHRHIEQLMRPSASQCTASVAPCTSTAPCTASHGLAKGRVYYSEVAADTARSSSAAVTAAPEAAPYVTTMDCAATCMAEGSGTKIDANEKRTCGKYAIDFVWLRLCLISVGFI